MRTFLHIQRFDTLKRKRSCGILRSMPTVSLIGVPELAAALGVDQSTVHRRIERGAITPTVTVGKRPLFSVEDAQAIMLGPAAPKAQERTS